MASAQQALLMVGGSSLISAPYWQILVTGNSGSNVSIVELEFIDGGGSVISTVGGTPSSSSNFSGGLASDQAFDGLLTSTDRWASLGLTNQELRMQFTGNVTPRQIKVYPFANGGSQNDAPKDLQVRYSFTNPTSGPWTNIGAANTGMTTGWVQYTARVFTVQ